MMAKPQFATFPLTYFGENEIANVVILIFTVY